MPRRALSASLRMATRRQHRGGQRSVSVPRRALSALLLRYLRSLDGYSNWQVSVPRRALSALLLNRRVAKISLSKGTSRFSAPKGIVCFATQWKVRPKRIIYLFQCPEGHCLLCYPGGSPGASASARSTRFSAPKGIVCFATRCCPQRPQQMGLVVSVPRRALSYLLPILKR